MQKTPQCLKIGLGGWEHEILNEMFYPRPDLAPADKLRWYARFFDTVEIRSTFWDDMLTVQDARRWLEAIADNPGFLLLPKLHGSFTHRKLIRPDLIRQTRALLQELAGRGHLGALLVQFPYAFTNTSAGRFHVVRLAELFRGFPLHFEFRHQSWNFPGLLHILEDSGAAPVSADLPRIRQFMPFTTGIVGESAYLRLHGRNEKGWLLNGLDTRYDYLYNARELQELRRRIEGITPSCKRVFVIFNTTTGGKAAANAFQLLSTVRGGIPLPLPATTLNAFPFLRDITGERIEESLLFHPPGYRAAM